MKERPILFSAPMVRAIIEGCKTQTRRVVKLPDGARQVAYYAPPSGRSQEGWADPGVNYWTDGGNHIDACPYGQPGDRLWVKETFYAWGRWETRYNAKLGRDQWHFIDMTSECGKEYHYAADPDDIVAMSRTLWERSAATPQWWKRPAIFMPRSASRITLEVTGVHVERVQDISEEDARAEGARCADRATGREVMFPDVSQHIGSWRLHFRELWDSINAARGFGWNVNPWVWAVEFRMVEG